MKLAVPGRIWRPKLKTVLLTYMLLIDIFVVITVSVLSYSQFKTIITERIALARVDVLRQVSERINRNNNTISVLSNFYYNNLPIETIAEFINGAEQNEERIRAVLTNMDKISAGTVEATGIDCHYVLSLKNGFSICSEATYGDFSLENYQKKLWYAKIIHAKGAPVWISTHRNFSNRREFVYSLARSINDPATGEPIGIFLINVEESNISSCYESMISTNAIYVVDSNGSIVSHSNKGMLGIKFYDMERLTDIVDGRSYCTIRKNHVDYLFSNYVNSVYEWLVVEEIPMASLLTPLMLMRRKIIVIDVLVVLLSAIIIFGIAGRTTRPLKKLSEGLRKVGDTGEKPGPFDDGGWSEISVISQECNNMLARIDALILDVKRTENEKRNAQMRFMQSQINPHFVYNTLFSIKCLVDMGSKDRALGIIDCFTVILKDILSVGNETTTVGKELEILSKYAALQKYRYGDIFDFETDVPPDLERCGILRMLLQPLVENAIFHGLASLDHRGKIRVGAKRVLSDMYITIEDNGRGIVPEDLEKLKQNRLSTASRQSNMIGIKNISDRISTYFGNEYGLEVESESGIGTRITLKLPILKE